MVDVVFDDKFRKKVSKVKNATIKSRVKKLITKIIENPETGKPMRFERKGTRELYSKPHRLSYKYYKNQNMIVFLNYYHKDQQ